MTQEIAIIIVTYNGSRWIKRCLASVFKSDYKNFSVIVVDNASDDGSADIVGREFPQVELVRLEKNTGFAGGNNIGIRRAMQNGCDAVVLLNQDTEIEPDFLAEIARASIRPEIGIVQGMLLLGEERSLMNNAGNAMHYLGFGFARHYRSRAINWLNQEPFEIGYASGCAMLIKREVLEKISARSGEGNGLRFFAFDEKFFAYHEDLDLCWRARLAGYKIMIAPKAVVYHYYEFHRNKKMFYWAERNRWACLLQNYSVASLIKLAPILLVIEAMMFVYSVATGWAHYKLKSYVWIIAGMPSILRQRQQVQKMRKAGDKEIIRHMDSKLEFSELDNPVLKYIVSPAVEAYYKLI